MELDIPVISLNEFLITRPRISAKANDLIHGPLVASNEPCERLLCACHDENGVRCFPTLMFSSSSSSESSNHRAIARLNAMINVQCTPYLKEQVFWRIGFRHDMASSAL